MERNATLEQAALSHFRQLRRIVRTAAALVAGLLANVILAVGSDGLMHATGVCPQLGQPMSDAVVLLAAAFRTIHSSIGC
jgi:hypothetical protein